MAMTKVGKLKLETSAYYQQKQSTNIRFYNMDINTSILRFIVTRNNNVLPLGKNNTDIMVYLKAQDGSWLIDEVSVSDELNGICEYQIPNEFLNHTGKVEGQVYISVDKKEDTVTEVDFTFTVEDALINQIPTVDKIAYIRKYTELENRLKEKVQNIEDAYKNIDDYITKVQQASETGVMQINDSKTIAITEIQNEKDNSITLINETSDTQIGFVSEKIETVNRMISDFKAQVDSELFVKHTDSEKWQKYATTESDGNRIILEQLTEDVNDGWDTETIEDVSGLMTTLESVSYLNYELKNTIRGAYSDAETYKDLGLYVKKLADELDSCGDAVMYIDENINEACR